MIHRRDIAETLRRGFSLFEIVIALAIMGLISSAVLSILWQAGGTAAEIRELDRRDEERNRFVDLLRQSIEALPPDASLTLIPPEESDSGYHEMRFENTSTAFIFGTRVGSVEEAYIALIPSSRSSEGAPLFDLALSRSDFVPDDSDGSGMVFGAGTNEMLPTDESGRYWVPLLTGIRGASWRFWDEEQQDWLEEWTEEDRLPPLLEFSIAEREGSVPIQLVYRVPDRLVEPDESGGSQQSSGSQQTSSTTAVQSAPARGGGDRGSDAGSGGRGGGDARRGGGRPGGPGGGRPGGGPGGRGPGGSGPGGGGPPPGGGGTGGGGSR